MVMCVMFIMYYHHAWELEHPATEEDIRPRLLYIIISIVIIYLLLCLVYCTYKAGDWLGMLAC